MKVAGISQFPSIFPAVDERLTISFTFTIKQGILVVQSKIVDKGRCSCLEKLKYSPIVPATCPLHG